MSRPGVVLMGSKPGSIVALSVLLERGWDVSHVVVSKDRHPWVQGPTLAEFADGKGVPTLEQSELPRDLEPDFVISYMYRYRVKAEVIARARRAALNFHAGPLPEYGGWAFYNMAILEDAAEYGCTCHYMDESFDTGPLLKVRRFPIDAAEETACSLERKAQAEMIRLFREFCELAESGAPLPVEAQDRTRMRYLTREEFEALKEIPADADPETVDRYARAFWYPPYPGAYIRRENARIEVVPSAAREHIAGLLHADDLDRLYDAVRRNP
ncbi:MAG: formyltransferase family protein [Planctomycetota bacterium]